VELAGASALDIARALAARELSPVDAVEHSFARIDEVNERVNAIVWVRRAALDDAHAAEARLAGGEPARPLEGVPLTVKDLCAIADGPTNMGSRAFEGFRFERDAEIVTRLKAAGAILVATTTTSELGNRPTTETELFGATRNPFDPARTSGGSSGGAGVSAALGIAPLNQGSDGGGSVRVPAACCGVYGLKPQRARISLAPFMAQEWGGLDVYGPITRTVSDAAAFLDATAGPATGEPYWAPPPERSFLSAVDEEPRLRIAVAFERGGEAVDPEVTDAVRTTADLLASMGHTVEEAAPALDALERDFLIVSGVGIGQHPMTDDQVAELEPRTRVVVEAARRIPALAYVQALDRMHAECRRALAFFDRYDLLLTPTVSRPAPPIGEIGSDVEDAWGSGYRNWLCWTWPFNCTGQPAASVPAGFSSDGLPIGVQLVGGAAAERTVLSVSAQLERARPW